MKDGNVMKNYFLISFVMCLTGFLIPLAVIIFCVGVVHQYNIEKKECGGKNPITMDWEDKQ